MNIHDLTRLVGSKIKGAGLLPLLDTPNESFFPIYRIYFDMLKGDIWACLVMAEILRLQNSEGGIANGGWVAFTFETIEKQYYISRHIFNKAIETLKPYGLESELKRHAMYPEAVKGIWHYRINKDVFIDAVLNSLLSEKDTPLKNFDHPSSNNLTTPPENSSHIVDISLSDLSNRDMHPTPNGVGASPFNGMNSSSQTKNKPSATDDTTPHTPTPYELVYREVRRKFFSIADDLGADDKVTGQVKKIAGYLWNQSARPVSESSEDKGAGLIRDIEHFIKWYNRKFDGALLPRSPEKLSAHWLAYLSTRPAHTPTAPYTMETWGGAVKTDTTNPPTAGGVGDTMMVDNNIFGFLFNRKDNGNE